MKQINILQNIAPNAYTASFTMGYGRPNPITGGVEGNRYLDLATQIIWTRNATQFVPLEALVWDAGLKAVYTGAAASVAAVGSVGSILAGTPVWGPDVYGRWSGATTAVGANNPASFIMQGWATADMNPIAMFKVQMPAVLTNLRMYIGCTTTTFTNVDAPTGEYFALRYNPTDLGDATFQFIQKGTGAAQLTATTTTPVAGRAYYWYFAKNSDNTVTVFGEAPDAGFANGSTYTISTANFTTNSLFVSQYAVWSRAAGGANQRTPYFGEFGGKLRGW